MTPRSFNKCKEKQKTENYKKRIMCHKDHPGDKKEVDDNDPIWDAALLRLPFPRFWTKFRKFSAETQIVDRIGNENTEEGLSAEVRQHKWETLGPAGCHHDDRRCSEMA